MKSLISPVHHSAPRWGGLLALALLMIQLGGCAIFRPAALKLPAGFAGEPQAAALANPQTRQAAYQALFPELSSIQASGTLVGANRWRRGKEVVDFTYYSRNDRAGTDHLLRLRGTRAQNSIFDIIVRGRIATIVLYLPKVVFEGEIPATGSPFAARLGIEPWDLVPIFTIGQHIAAADFRSKRGRWTTTLNSREEAGALKSVSLENSSGLPRSAEWEIGGKTYVVSYLGWGFIVDSLTGIRRLMPTALQVQRGGTTVSLELRAYQYDKQATAGLFKLDPKVQNYQLMPLEQLKEIL